MEAWRDPAGGPNLATIGALMARARNELAAGPGRRRSRACWRRRSSSSASTASSARLTNLTGFTTDSYASFVVPVSMLQGAGFTGAAAGVNLARDIEQGWLDRLLVSPAPRWVLLAGTVLAAGARALIPATFVFAIALRSAPAFRASTGSSSPTRWWSRWPPSPPAGARMLALHFKSQSAAPLMQAGMLALIFLTPAYAPLALLQGWLHDVAEVNPMTQVIEAARQGFVGGVSWTRHLARHRRAGGAAPGAGNARPREMRRTAI